MSTRVCVQVNRPTPQRTPLLDALALAPEVELHVLYRWRDTGGRDWGELPLEHSHEFLDGLPPSQAVKAATSEIRNHDPDILLSYGYEGPLALGMSIAGRRWQLPYALRSDSNITKHLQSPWTRRVARRVVARALFPASRTTVLTIGIQNARYWTSIGYRSHLYVPYRVLEPPGQRDAIAHTRPSGLPIVLYVGRLSHEKGIDRLIEAITLSKRAYELVVVGDGPLRPYVLKAAAANPAIQSVGAIPYASLGSYYQAAALTVVPSRREAWGLVVNEALNFGTPVVATPEVGAARDLAALNDVAIAKSGAPIDIASAIDASIGQNSVVHQDRVRPSHVGYITYFAACLRRVASARPRAWY